MKRLFLCLWVGSAVLLLSGCKVTRPMLEAVVSASNKVSGKLTYADSCRHATDIPYVEGGTSSQVMDIYYADGENRRDAVLIDIHGGFYVAGNRKNNRSFASVFLKEGYDVVLLEYRLNDGDLDVADELQDCATALDYLVDHAAERGLNKDRMFLTGDSAGGHLALYLAEGAVDASLPVRPERFKPKGVLLNCPAYDFATFAHSGSFSKSALEWFIGPRYQDAAWMASMSPRTFIGSYTGPLFVSTCTRDFIRGQALLVKSDCDALGRPVEFMDMASDDRAVGHVHNVVNPDLSESQAVNAGMIRFMERYGEE